MESDKEKGQKHLLFKGALLEVGGKLDELVRTAGMLTIVALMQQEEQAAQDMVLAIAKGAAELREKIRAYFGQGADLVAIYKECNVAAQELVAAEKEAEKGEGKVEVPGMSAGYL